MWKDVFSGVPQGSILGLLMLNVYQWHICFIDNACLSNYADDTTLYKITTLTDILSVKAFHLYKNNFMTITCF